MALGRFGKFLSRKLDNIRHRFERERPETDNQAMMRGGSDKQEELHDEMGDNFMGGGQNKHEQTLRPTGKAKGLGFTAAETRHDKPTTPTLQKTSSLKQFFDSLRKKSEYKSPEPLTEEQKEKYYQYQEQLTEKDMGFGGREHYLQVNETITRTSSTGFQDAYPDEGLSEDELEDFKELAELLEEPVLDLDEEICEHQEVVDFDRMMEEEVKNAAHEPQNPRQPANENDVWKQMDEDLEKIARDLEQLSHAMTLQDGPDHKASNMPSPPSTKQSNTR